MLNGYSADGSPRQHQANRLFVLQASSKCGLGA